MTNQYIADADQAVTDAELLRNVRNALARITFNGQEYVTADGQRVTLARYSELVASERALNARVNAASAGSGSGVNLVEFQERRT